MKLLKQKAEIISNPNSEKAKELVELAGRTCYNSYHNIEEGSSDKFIEKIIDMGHESVLEHFSFSVFLLTNRAIANQIVRHRIASYSQMSTRYINFSKRVGFEFIIPNAPEGELDKIIPHLENSCNLYRELIDSGCNPEVARDVLPLCTATRMVMTMNIRAWRNFLLLRMKKCDPQMMDLVKCIVKEIKAHKLDIFFKGVL